eukprot:COSAG03_NODE_1156_length_4692_cov_5.187895_3_plen_121_part_00
MNSCRVACVLRSLSHPRCRRSSVPHVVAMLHHCSPSTATAASSAPLFASSADFSLHVLVRVRSWALTDLSPFSCVEAPLSVIPISVARSTRRTLRQTNQAPECIRIQPNQTIVSVLSEPR